VLASRSPRRYRILKSVGLNLKRIYPKIDEKEVGDNDVYTRATKLAELKVLDAKRRIGEIDKKTMILSADTEVICDGRILGKPTDAAEAKRMLEMLSGRSHEVVTGYFILAMRVIDKTEKSAYGKVITHVSFRKLSSFEIDLYISSGQWRDKAGGYGIQQMGGMLVDRVRGSYLNVVGLPLREVIDSMNKLALLR
jgi:septum formation protein